MSLQVWLPFTDKTGTTNKGCSGTQPAGVPASYSASRFGNVATFNSNHVSFNGSTTFAYTGDFTYALWFKITTTDTSGRYIFTSGRADAGAGGFGIACSGCQLRFWYGVAQVIYQYNVSANTWYHVAVVKKGNNHSIYLDGVLKTTVTQGTNPTYTDSNGLGIGGFWYNGGFLYPFIGQIFDFRLYDNALTELEVKELAKGLIFHYDFNDRLTDVSGNGYNASVGRTCSYTNGDLVGPKSLYLNGNGYIRTGYSVSSVDKLTISYWVKTHANSGAYCCMVSQENNPHNGFWIAHNCESRKVWFYTGSYEDSAGSLTNGQMYHIVFVYDGNATDKAKWYVDGKYAEPVRSTTKTALNMVNLVIGNSYTGSSWNTTNYSTISDFRMYGTCLSADDIAKMYRARASISYDATVHAHSFNEATGNIKINKNGIVSSGLFAENDVKLKYDNNIYIESDGSAWYRIFHHANCGSKLFNRTDDFANGVYIDADRWFNVNVCNYLNKYEFLIKQKPTANGTQVTARWIQTGNPMIGNAGTITTVSGDANGGLCRYQGSASTYLAHTQNNTWFNAIGSAEAWNNGIPGFYGQAVTTGFLDLYVRIDNGSFTSSTIPDKTKFYNNNIIVAKEIIAE